MPGLDRLRIARYLGFCGAIALAAAAYLGGAWPGSDLRSNLPRIWSQPYGPLTLSVWLGGTGLMVGAWWLAGRAAPTTRWVLVTTLLWVLPLLLAPPLGSRDVYAYACQGAVYAAGLDPYAVGPSALPCPWLGSISLIWRETSAPYGPLYVALAGAAAWLAHGNLWLTIGLLRLIAVGGLLLTAWYLPRLARSPSRATWLALATPLVGVHLVSGAHNDALMIGLVIAGLYHATGRRPLVSGAFFGAAIAVKATGGIALPFALLLAARPSLVRAGGWLAAGCVGAYAAVFAVTGLGFGWISGLQRSGDSVQWTSIPTGVGLAVGWLLRITGGPDVTGGVITVVRAIGLVVLLATLVTLWWRAGWSRAGWSRSGWSRAGWMRARTDGVLERCGWALLAVTALAPVFHPWYWLLPLSVLAAAGVTPRWLVITTGALAFLVLPDGYNLARATRLVGSLVVLAVVIAGVVVLVRRRVPARSSG